MNGTVVVGVDGSQHSRAALLAALHEAAGRNAGVLLVHVRPFEPREGDTPARRNSRAILDRMHAYARDVAPSVPVDRRGGLGRPATGLLAMAADADLLVVGASGSGRLGMPPTPGSTCRDLIAHCPVPLEVVRRAPQYAHDRIVLGVNTLHPDSAPVRHAFESARRDGARLSVVYYGPLPDGSFQDDPLQDGPLQGGPFPGGPFQDGLRSYGTLPARGSRAADDMYERARKQLEAELHRFANLWSVRYPRTRVAVQPALGMGENALLAASIRADLLVIGRADPVSGPTGNGHPSPRVLNHAACPLVIVPCVASGASARFAGRPGSRIVRARARQPR
jgi:nucleotide-binding universal stress UspA family protein